MSKNNKNLAQNNPIDNGTIKILSAAFEDLSPENQEAIANALCVILRSYSSTDSRFDKNEFATQFANWLNAPITDDAALYFCRHFSSEYKWSWGFNLDSAYIKAIQNVDVMSYSEIKLYDALKTAGMTMEDLFQKAGLEMPKIDRLEQIYGANIGGCSLKKSFPTDEYTGGYSGADIHEPIHDLKKHGGIGCAIAASFLQKCLIDEKQKTSALEQKIKELESKLSELNG